MSVNTLNKDFEIRFRPCNGAAFEIDSDPAEDRRNNTEDAYTGLYYVSIA